MGNQCQKTQNVSARDGRDIHPISQEKGDLHSPQPLPPQFLRKGPDWLLIPAWLSVPSLCLLLASPKSHSEFYLVPDACPGYPIQMIHPASELTEHPQPLKSQAWGVQSLDGKVCRSGERGARCPCQAISFLLPTEPRAPTSPTSSQRWETLKRGCHRAFQNPIPRCQTCLHLPSCWNPQKSPAGFLAPGEVPPPLSTAGDGHLKSSEPRCAFSLKVTDYRISRVAPCPSLRKGNQLFTLLLPKALRGLGLLSHPRLPLLQAASHPLGPWALLFPNT